MIWKGKKLKTYGDIGNALKEFKSPEEAREFMRLYSETTPHAYANVGYITGYFDGETAARLQEWCQTSHPIFGRTRPTPEQAIEAGKKLGRERRP